MTEPDEQDEATEPAVTDVPEPDQEPHEPIPDEVADEEDGTPEQPAGVPDAQSTTPEQWEARHKKAEKAFRTYTNAVGRIYEDEATDYLQCPLCADPPAGFLHPQNVGKFPDEVVGAVMTVLGQMKASDVPEDPYSHVCETCNGWGVVKTGSLVPNQEVRSCLDCRGLGFIPTDDGAKMALSDSSAGAHEQNGVFVPAATGPESPEIEALRLRGYTIVPPMQTNP